VAKVLSRFFDSMKQLLFVEAVRLWIIAKVQYFEN
jgi:hypothetical protein